MRIVGMMIVGGGEAERYLDRSLHELKRLCDTAVICCNHADEKTLKMVMASGFHWYEDDREWGIDQPRIKQDCLEIVGRYQPDWVVAIDADEVFDPDFDRASLERLANERGVVGWYVYVVNLWDSETQYRMDISFWNIRLFKYPLDPENRRWEDKSLHCGLAPKFIYHRGSYAPVILLHKGLMDKRNRQRKVERYKRYDPESKFKAKDYYQTLAWEGKPDPFELAVVRKAVQDDVAKIKRPNKEHKAMAISKSKKYFIVQREDGETIDLPEEHYEATMKRHPQWVLVREIVPGQRSEAQAAPVVAPVIPDPLECSLCGFIGKNDKSLGAHKTKAHGV